MHLTIRRATAQDAAAIAAFNCALAQESEGKTLDRSLVEVGVRAVLEDPDKGLYYLAEHQGQPLGQVMVTYEWSDWRNGWFWWIQSVYVVSAFRRRGIFRRLFDHVRQEARRRGDVIGLRLYYDQSNEPALRTYLALGMEPTSYRVLEEYPLR